MLAFRSQRPWMGFWGAKIAAASRKYLRLACVIKVIIIDIEDYSHAHLCTIISNYWTSNCKMAIFLMKPVLATFTIVGPIIWCDNPQVRMWKILYIYRVSQKKVGSQKHGHNYSEIRQKKKKLVCFGKFSLNAAGLASNLSILVEKWHRKMNMKLVTPL